MVQNLQLKSPFFADALHMALPVFPGLNLNLDLTLGYNTKSGAHCPRAKRRKSTFS